MFLLIRENIVNVKHIIAIVKDKFLEKPPRYKVFLTAQAEGIPLTQEERDLLLHTLALNHLTLLHPCVNQPESAECQQLQQEPLNYDTLSATETD